MESQINLPTAAKRVFDRSRTNGMLLFIALLIFALLRSGSSFPYDILINLNGIRNLRQTGMLYSWSPSGPIPLYDSFIGSPFVAILLYPFSFLESNLAVSLYRFCCTVIYVLAIVLLSRTYNLKINSRTTVAGWSWLIWLAWLPSKDSFDLGQLNEIILFALAIAYWGWMTNRDVAAGIGIGIAAAIKVSPVMLVLLPVLSGHWRMAVVAVLITALFGGLSCGVVGINQCMVFGTTIFPNLSRGSADWYHIGLNGLWYRLLTMNQTTYWTNLQPPPSTIISQILIIVELFVFIAIGYRITRPERCTDQTKSALMAFWIAGLLLLSPVTWWHYAIWLLIGIPTLLEFARLSSRRTRWGIGLGILLINVPPLVLLGFGTASGSALLTYILLTVPCIGLIILSLFFGRIATLPVVQP